MIEELDIVVLTRDVEQPPLLKGSKGAVVHCCGDGEGFEVEFVRETGETVFATEEGQLILFSLTAHLKDLALHSVDWVIPKAIDCTRRSLGISGFAGKVLESAAIVLAQPQN
jgi:acid stress-induced BolA-like protein IbaG/YrbA